MTRLHSVVALSAAALLFAAAPSSVRADAASCQKAIVKGLAKYKKTYLKSFVKCLKKQNNGDIPGPCPDAAASAKIADKKSDVVAKIAASCTPADLTTLNYRTDCAYEMGTAGKEGSCEALAVGTDPTLLAQCLACWKEAELAEYIAILFASHVTELCGVPTGTSASCSDLECVSLPLPDQRDLTGGEGDCQLGIGKAGTKYLLKREKTLEKCALAGGTAAACLADADVQAKLAKIETSKQTKIHRKCGNRDPALSPAFCCRVGMGNACSAATSRNDCVMNLMGEVKEDQICGMGGTCDPVMGNKQITWWTSCPESNMCPGTALSTLDDLITCVDDSADAIVDKLMCLQFRGGGGTDWPCPANE
jgi:hypothetical protein